MSDFEDALSQATSGNEIEADFSACKDDFDNPAPSDYPVKVATAEPGKSKQGNPVVKVVFEVTDDSYKGKLFASLPYTGKGAFKLRKFLRALGFDVEGKTFRLDPAAMVGKTAIAVVTEESADYSSVDELKPSPSATLGSFG